METVTSSLSPYLLRRSGGQVERNGDQAEHIARRLYEAIFASPSKNFTLSPEMTTWGRFLARQITALSPNYFEPILPVLEYLKDGQASTLELFLEISTILRDSVWHVTTIDDVAETLYTKRHVASAETKSATQHEVRQAIFAIIGLLTMLYTPSPAITAGSFTLLIPDGMNSIRRQEPCNKSRNTLSSFLRGFGKLIPLSTIELSGESMAQGDKGELIVSKLSYFSLRHISDMRISWTNDLSSHLFFNEKTHVLLLFRLPSFCYVQIQNHGQASIFRYAVESLCTQLNIDYDDKNDLCRMFLDEILLSYRIIFGHESGSRRLFKSTQRKKAGDGGITDQFLNHLCGSAIIDSHGPLDIRLGGSAGVYSKEDFPIFGGRMMILHSFSTRQRPSKLLEFWRDRRNPLAFLNLWSVIFFGIITILLSALQLLVGVIQLVVAYEQLSQGRSQSPSPGHG